MPLFELVVPIHLKHYLDGFPLCWPMEKTGTFESTANEAEVTCPECKIFMED